MITMPKYSITVLIVFVFVLASMSHDSGVQAFPWSSNSRISSSILRMMSPMMSWGGANARSSASPFGARGVSAEEAEEQEEGEGGMVGLIGGLMGRQMGGQMGGLMGSFGEDGGFLQMLRMLLPMIRSFSNVGGPGGRVPSQQRPQQQQPVPTMPQMSQMPAPTMPQMPQMPAPTMPQMPQMPAPTWPQMPQMPAPTMPQMPQMPAPTMPQMPQMPAPTWPQMPKMPAPTMPQMPQMPAPTWPQQQPNFPSSVLPDSRLPVEGAGQGAAIPKTPINMQNQPAPEPVPEPETTPKRPAEIIDLNMEVDDDVRPAGGFALKMWLCDQQGGVCAYQCESLSDTIFSVNCGNGPKGKLYCCDQ